jgi:hypothetical protein
MEGIVESASLLKLPPISTLRLELHYRTNCRFQFKLKSLPESISGAFHPQSFESLPTPPSPRVGRVSGNRSSSSLPPSQNSSLVAFLKELEEMQCSGEGSKEIYREDVQRRMPPILSQIEALKAEYADLFASITSSTGHRSSAPQLPATSPIPEEEDSIFPM